MTGQASRLSLLRPPLPADAMPVCLPSRRLFTCEVSVSSATRCRLFVLDYRAGGAPDTWPNWREDLICRRCHMSNRQRLLAHLAAVEAAGRRQPALYLMEETTPLYRWFRRHFGQVSGNGPFACEPGQRLLPWQLNQVSTAQPLRSLYHFANSPFEALLLGDLHHEDVTRLSFPADSFDAIVSGDVFEHVPEPAKAFEECARVLKPDGVLLATLPVNWLRDDSVTRARLGIDGALSLATTPVYHGNPLSDEGSLVFTDFGWDVLSSMARAGLRNVSMALYRAPGVVTLGQALPLSERRVGRLAPPGHDRITLSRIPSFQCLNS